MKQRQKLIAIYALKYSREHKYKNLNNISYKEILCNYQANQNSSKHKNAVVYKRPKLIQQKLKKIVYENIIHKKEKS